MNEKLLLKLENLADRREELNHLLSQPETMSDQNNFRRLSIELSEISMLVEHYETFKQLQNDLADSKELLSDAEMAEIAKEEVAELNKSIDAIESEIQLLLVPKDPNDDRNIFLEIRAGTGGDEAAIFSGDLFKMYSSFAQTQGWNVEIMNESFGEHGGYKEIITQVSGKGVYSRLKFESGAHRVQRVPDTETQGRVHTSACTVAVLAIPDEVEQIDINPADLRVDTYRASGAGGQHINKTDSAVRITHLPTGTVVECQDERSQHKNRARAMSILQARLIDAQQSKQAAETSETRKSLVGSGDRSERIRTYNYPQGRMTDHRINLTLYKLDEIMSGGLAQVVEPLISEHNADLLAQMSND